MPKPPLDPRLLAYARQMRHEQTDAESKLWRLLRNRRLAGLKFRRQVPMGGYVLDFYCHDAQLAVELDGGQHNDDEGKRYDDGRTEALGKIGVRVIRFWNPQVLMNPDFVLEAIYENLTQPTSQPPSP